MTNKPKPKSSELSERMAVLTMYLVFACGGILALALTVRLAMLILGM